MKKSIRERVREKDKSSQANTKKRVSQVLGVCAASFVLTVDPLLESACGAFVMVSLSIYKFTDSFTRNALILFHTTKSIACNLCFHMFMLLN